MYGVTLIVVVALLGGIVAYIGDQVGRRVGRRRLSLYGLRPRYTSMIVTVVTGILIAGTTLVVLAVVSSDVRTALFSMRQLQDTLARTQVELADTIQKSRVQQALADRLAHDIRLKSAEVDRLEARLVQVEQERQAAAVELARVRGEMEKVRAAAQKAEAAYQVAQKDLDQQAGRLRQLRQQAKDLEGQVAQLTHTKTLLQKQVQALEGTLNVQLFGNVAFRAGEPVASTVLAGGRPLAQVRQDILQFLRGPANQEAVQRGAAYQGHETVFIVDQSSLDQAAQAVSGGHGKFVVRAVSLYNSLAGNPVTIQLRTFPNRLIFHSGEEIVWEVVPASQSGDSLQTAFLRLLGEANERAVQLGMATGPGGITGQVSWQDTLMAISQARQLGGEVRVSLVAGQDIWSAEGPLVARWKVQPVALGKPGQP